MRAATLTLEHYNNAEKQGAAAALALSSGREVKWAAALTLAEIGEASRSQALAEDVEKDNPSHTLLHVYWLPTIHAAIEINKGNSAQAIAGLEPAAPYELGLAGTQINYLYPAYERGQAYLLGHNGRAAALEFQKLLDLDGRPPSPGGRQRVGGPIFAPRQVAGTPNAETLGLRRDVNVVAKLVKGECHGLIPNCDASIYEALGSQSER